MKYHFEKPSPLVIVTMKLRHYDKEVDLEVALDTGAVTTMINRSIAQYLGCDPGGSLQKRHILTASGIEWCSLVHLDKVTACGKSLEKLEVICHDLPPATTIRGLLGENFLKWFEVRINYKERWVELC